MEYKFAKREFTIGESIRYWQAYTRMLTHKGDLFEVMAEIIHSRLEEPDLSYDELLDMGVSQLDPLWQACIAAVGEAEREISEQREVDAAITEAQRLVGTQGGSSGNNV